MRITGRKQKKEIAAANAQGLKLLAERRHQEAYEFLTQAVRQFPDEPELRMHYASSLLAVRPESAVPEIVTAVELGPDEPIRLTRAAGILFRMGQVETARSYAIRAKELAPPDFLFMPYLLNLDGHFAALEGKDAMAEEGFRLAVEQEPDGETFAVDLAKFLNERNRQAEALEVINEALPRTKRPEPLELLRSEIVES
ncbi:MAG TPA: hypothetical protein VFX44_02200 [Solirubrobacterales bacterium]|nr:hypothetical protein [Solirubrobacterales bacterium]